MAFLKKRFDKKAQESGKWVEYDGGEFLVASISSTEFIKGYSALTDKFEGVEDKEEFLKDLNVLLATSVLLDWKGVVDDDGKDVKYTIEDGVELLEDDGVFSNWLFNYAKEVNNYKREALKAKVKK